MTLVLDAGAFVAIERGDRDLAGALKREVLAGRPPVTHGGVVGQVWRGGAGSQAPVSRALAGVDVVPLGDDLGRRAGMLMRLSGTGDVVDAALALLALDDDEIVTSDPEDLAGLLSVHGTRGLVVPV